MMMNNFLLRLYHQHKRSKHRLLPLLPSIIYASDVWLVLAGVLGGSWVLRVGVGVLVFETTLLTVYALLFACLLFAGH